MSEAPTTLYSRWEALQDDQVTPEAISALLGAVPDDLWATAACVDRILNDTTAQQSILLHGIARTDKVTERLDSTSTHVAGNDEALLQHFSQAPEDAQLLQLRAVLLQRLDRLNTYVEMEKVASTIGDEEAASSDEDDGGQEEEEEEMDEWDDDPWAEAGGSSSTPSTPKRKPAASLPVGLPEFISGDIVASAKELASLELFDAVLVLFTKHASELWPARYSILDAIPEHADPLSYRQLLPAIDPSSNMELKWKADPWRRPDVAETSSVIQAIQELALNSFHALPGFSQDQSLNRAPLDSAALRQWYIDRVERTISTTGIIDIALAITQHGASQGVSELDELGEELSLLSRLVYDAPKAEVSNADYTIDTWRAMGPEAVIRAYLAHSQPESLAQDMTRLVLPYLYVLEARAERSGNPDPELINRLLCDYVLTAPLELAAAVFEASKPTSPAAQRILRNDEDVARLALACLYGSNSLNEWPVMSRIFECMPAWDADGDNDGNEEAADTTLVALGDFVKPTTSRPNCTPAELLAFFKPLTVDSLSRALDFLDIHLESGEILARWSVPAPLRWFLQSHNDIREQTAWANRMARRAGGAADPLKTQSDWDWLLEDMLKLTEQNEAGLPGAFGLLTKDDIYGIYLSGLLSTGRFDIAKSMLHGSHPKLSLPREAVEEICLKCSGELYDNASSANYKIGDMKLAYDCLGVPEPTDIIQLEKEFIEATSRIASFNVMSRAGVPISPIEIRLTKDRLTLVSRVLSSNGDAYKHTEVILDLTYKLGFRNDISATAKALAMLAESAIQAEDYDLAYDNTQRMVKVIQELQSSQRIFIDDTKLKEAMEVCWITCFQLGRHPEYNNLANKMKLLGQALDLCPADKMHDVITAWRRIQKEDLESREERLNTSQGDYVPSAHPVAGGFIPRTVASSLRARLKDLHMPSPPLLSTPDAAALASRTFKTVASNFPFSIGHKSHSHVSDDKPRSESGSRRDVEEVSSQASRAFSKGIGWLIGAEDE